MVRYSSIPDCWATIIVSCHSASKQMMDVGVVAVCLPPLTKLRCLDTVRNMGKCMQVTVMLGKGGVCAPKTFFHIDIRLCQEKMSLRKRSKQVQAILSNGSSNF